MPNEPFKRKRVKRACESCRALKTKCDGKLPICGRCEGYGYACDWQEKGQTSGTGRDCEADGGSSLDAVSVGNAIRAYENVICNLCEKSSDTERAATELRLSLIRSHLPQDVVKDKCISEGLAATQQRPPISPHASAGDRIACQERYHGEASDVQFFNAVKQIFGKRPSSERSDDGDLESYEQEDPYQRLRKAPDSPRPPKKQLADTYVDIYFSTIHIAYPFVCKPRFFEEYKQFCAAEAVGEMESSSLALIYTIFAIGGYYVSFPSSGNPENHPHGDYYRHAQVFLEHTADSRSLGYVCALLAQCFYLLAVSQTERCWTTLGLAVRAAQSIGLHVERPCKNQRVGFSASDQEVQRRTWYSLYVLDRLLALQLGRPPAIHEGFISVELPQRVQHGTFDSDDGQVTSPGLDKTEVNDYFLNVIKFSRIIELVMLELYNPFYGKKSAEETLSLAAQLDERLTTWKRNLPRALRFDLGHTFEKSVVFHRQRNMLAVKYHHLRALIHRPFLCPSSLRLANGPFQTLSENEHRRMMQSRGTCISEAQNTAHLLHKVSDERTLVQEFPWWQMIPCLICASSILLVASAGAHLNADTYEVAADTLDEDAETCLTVFEALSINSDAARLGRNMMKGLKEAGTRSRNGGYRLDPNNRIVPSSITPSLGDACDPTAGQGFVDEFGDWQLWPGEISDSMTWSAQFVDAAYIPFLESL